MPAPKKNQFWLLRAKHGRDRIIEDPQALSDSADEYFNFCIENPLEVEDYRGNPPKLVKIKKPRVFQKEALAVFCGVSCWRTINDLKDTSKDFLQVITRIENIIKTQKFEYAAIGEFNANIIARDLGLKDSSDVTTGGEKLPSQPTQMQIIIKRKSDADEGANS